MNRILILTVFIPMALSAQENQPQAKKEKHELTIHNHTRIDNYFWMNQRDSKDVIDYINQENEVSSAYFSQNKKLTDQLLSEFESRIDPNEKYAPFILNGNTFQSRYQEGLDYPITYLINSTTERAFIDQNSRSKDHPYYDLGDWSPSPNNELVAMSEDFIGRRNYVISIRKFDNETYLDDQIAQTDGSFEWANDNTTMFYVKKDPQTLRSFQVFRHILGTPQDKDVLVYEEKDEKYEVGIEKSLNQAYIIIQCQSSLTSEVKLIDANDPTSEPQTFLKREQGHLYEVEVHDEGFYILSNKNAPNRKLLFTSNRPVNIEECTTIIDHSTQILLENITVFKHYIIVQNRENGLQKIRQL